MKQILPFLVVGAGMLSVMLSGANHSVNIAEPVNTAKHTALIEQAINS